MKVTDELVVLHSELDAITPKVGRVHHTLLAKFDPAGVVGDVLFEDPALGRVIKSFVISPGDDEERRHTTGKAYSLGDQEFVITGFCSVVEGGGADLALLDAFDAVRDRLRKLFRLPNADGSQSEAVNEGNFRGAGMTTDRVAGTLCFVKSIRFTISERKAV